MSKTTRRHAVSALTLSGVVLASATLASAAALGTSQGPRTTIDPYVQPLDATAVQIQSLLTVNNLAAGGLSAMPMAGVPDGLGAFPDGSGKVTVLANHELQATQGSVRAHGTIGSFVSKWTLDPVSGDVTNGSDLMTSVDYSGTPATAFGRFCSADLAGASQLFNTVSGKGYNGQIFFNGEETGSEGRGVATEVSTGNSKVINAFGKMSFENSLAAFTPASDNTVIISNSDAGGAVNSIYIGTKTNSGSAFDKAGLTNGNAYGFVVTGAATDAAFRTAFGKNTPAPFTLTASPVTGATGALQQTAAKAMGAIAMDRTEDGSWDPQNPNVYYFVTTGSTVATPTHGRGGLWRMRFNDVNNPALGGDMTLLLDGNEPNAMYMADNITVDNHGHIVLLEDPGADAYVAKVHAYDIGTGTLAAVATFDPLRFDPVNTGSPVGTGTFMTNDEESSGVIDTEATLGAGSFLFDAQVHTQGSALNNTLLTNPATQVEHGQLMKMNIDFTKVFTGNNPVVPETPLTVLIPVTAGALGLGVFMIRRRSTVRAAN